MWYYAHDDYDVYNERDDTDTEEMKETQERSWMRMNRIILASHGGLSAGMKDTVQMILGEMPNLYALATLRDETEPITAAARRLLDGFAAEDAVYIVTDVMGGSVNNEMLTLLPEYLCGAVPKGADRLCTLTHWLLLAQRQRGRHGDRRCSSGQSAQAAVPWRVQVPCETCGCGGLLCLARKGAVQRTYSGL